MSIQTRISLSPGATIWLRFTRNRVAVFCLGVLVAMFIVTIVAPWFSPYTYDQIDANYMHAGPDLETGHLFGTDLLGRDLFVRTMHGGRRSLMVGLVATFVSLFIGVLWGSIAGYIGGNLDHFMMRVVDVHYALTFVFFAILLMVFFGRNIILIFVAIGAVNWLDMARIVRGQTLSLKERPFIEAARALGLSNRRIIFGHIIPNLFGVVVVYSTLIVPQAILLESVLSFLGLGVSEPMASWGTLVNDGRNEMEIAPWLLFYPSMFLAATLFCFLYVGDGLRDALDPRSR